MIRCAQLTAVLEFLEIPKPWATIIGCTVGTSAEVLDYMNTSGNLIPASTTPSILMTQKR